MNSEPITAHTLQHSGFYIFIFLFFIKIYFRNPNLYEYIPATPLSGGRGLSVKKKFTKKLRFDP